MMKPIALFCRYFEMTKVQPKWSTLQNSRYCHSQAKFHIKGAMQIKHFANQLQLPLEKLHSILINIGVDESEISTVINPSIMELVLKTLNTPYEYHTVNPTKMRTLMGEQYNPLFCSRPPVVTIVGHIDHGKTTLLDTLRESTIAVTEVGGITQKIGAFTAYDKQKKPICFVDTPGHFAFHSSRSRGVQPADMILLIIAIDDGIQEQTIECVRLIKSISLPVIVVINKIDKVKQPDSIHIQNELIKYGIITKAMGGNVDCVEISARRNIGVGELLRVITKNSTEIGVGYDTSLAPTGFILDCKQEKQLGLTASVLLRNGSLAVGDFIQTSSCVARIKIIIDENGNRLKKFGAAFPAKIVGWKSEPLAGDIFEKVPAKEAKKQNKKFTVTVNSNVTNALNNANYNMSNVSRYSFVEDLLMKSDIDTLLDVSHKSSYSIANPLLYKIIAKADSQSGLDAILQSIGQCADKRVKFDLLGCGIGLPTTDEITIAKNSKCNIYCFFNNTNPPPITTSNVTIEYHDIIYHLISSIKEHIEIQLGDTINITQMGEAKVKKVFKFTGKIKHIVAGCEVISGQISKSLNDLTYCLIYENGQLIKKATINSLKQFNKDTTQINEGAECGIIFNNFNQFKENQLIKQYKIIKEKVPLDWKI